VGRHLLRRQLFQDQPAQIVLVAELPFGIASGRQIGNRASVPKRALPTLRQVIHEGSHPILAQLERTERGQQERPQDLLHGPPLTAAAQIGRYRGRSKGRSGGPWPSLDEKLPIPFATPARCPTALRNITRGRRVWRVARAPAVHGCRVGSGRPWYESCSLSSGTIHREEKAMTVNDICTRPAMTADPDETIVEAARRMRDRHVGDLIVTDSTGRPVGLLTDRDIVVSAVAQSPDRLEALLVGDLMSREVVTARTSETLDAALRTMRSRGIRRLPVVSADGRLEGIVSFDDILERLSTELDELVRLVATEQKRERAVRR
jgi:CBS domain-containing protein